MNILEIAPDNMQIMVVCYQPFQFTGSGTDNAVAKQASIEIKEA